MHHIINEQQKSRYKRLKDLGIDLSHEDMIDSTVYAYTMINEHNNRVDLNRRHTTSKTFIGGLALGILIGLTISAVFIDIMIIK